MKTISTLLFALLAVTVQAVTYISPLSYAVSNTPAPVDYVVAYYSTDGTNYHTHLIPATALGAPGTITNGQPNVTFTNPVLAGTVTLSNISLSISGSWNGAGATNLTGTNSLLAGTINTNLFDAPTMAALGGGGGGGAASPLIMATAGTFTFTNSAMTNVTGLVLTFTNAGYYNFYGGAHFTDNTNGTTSPIYGLASSTNVTWFGGYATTFNGSQSPTAYRVSVGLNDGASVTLFDYIYSNGQYNETTFNFLVHIITPGTTIRLQVRQNPANGGVTSIPYGWIGYR